MFPGRRDSDQDEAENSGQAFQNDVDELYGSPEDEDDPEEADDTKQEK
jgi:hypothetical protein